MKGTFKFEVVYSGLDVPYQIKQIDNINRLILQCVSAKAQASKT